MVIYSKCCFHITVQKKVCLSLTAACNFNCSYCFSKLNNNNFNFNSLVELSNLLKRNGIKYIILTGGEPLLYNRLFEVIQFLVYNKFEVSLCTNAFFAEDSICKQLNKVKLKKVTISLDVIDQYEFEKIKCVSHSYYKVINGIQNFVNNNFDVTINVVIKDTKYGYFESIVRFCEQLKVKKVCFTIPVCKNAVPEKFSEKVCDSILQMLTAIDKLSNIEIEFDNPQCNSNDCPSQKNIFGIDSFKRIGDCLVKKYLLE